MAKQKSNLKLGPSKHVDVTRPRSPPPKALHNSHSTALETPETMSDIDGAAAAAAQVELAVAASQQTQSTVDVVHSDITSLRVRGQRVLYTPQPSLPPRVS